MPDPDHPGPSDLALARDPAFIDLLLRSYRELLGRDLAPPTADVAGWLYDAPFCVLAHNVAADPRFVYVNRAAQACFESTWEQMTCLPSRLSAETPNRTERQNLLDAVARDGFATGYRGLRIAASGRRFWIEDVTIWQLTDVAGAVCGQAATYARWRDAK